MNSCNGVHLRYSIRSHCPVTVLDVLELMCSIIGGKNKNKIVIGAREYRDRERFKLHEFSLPTPLGWQPKTSLIEGLTKLMSERESIFLSRQQKVEN